MIRLTGIRILALGVVLWAIAVWLFGTHPPVVEDMAAEPAAPAQKTAEGKAGATVAAAAGAGAGADAAGEDPSRRTGATDTAEAAGAGTTMPASGSGAEAAGAGTAAPASGSGAEAVGAGTAAPASGSGAGAAGAGTLPPASGSGAEAAGAGTLPPASGSGAEAAGAGTLPLASGSGAEAAGAGTVPPASGTTAAATTPGTDVAGVPPVAGTIGVPITVPDADEVGMEALASQIVAARRAAWQGRFEDALAHYRAAARIRPWSHVVWGEMGNVLWTMRRWPEAAYALEGAATLLVDAGEFRAANDLLPAVGQLDPEAAHRVRRRLWIVSQPPSE